MKRIIDRSFVVRAPLELAWKHFSEIEKWPTWARHIRSVEKSPPGPLSLETRGTMRLTNGVKSTFAMTEFEPMQHWKWVGRVLGSEVYYDHIFAESEPGQTTMRFIIDASGWSVGLLGGIFGSIYRKNLDRAVPLLVQEIEAAALRSQREGGAKSLQK